MTARPAAEPTTAEQAIAAPDFDPPTLRRDLRPLNYAEPHPPTAQEAAYLAYYGIDFATEFSDITHHFGALETADHRIAVHLWEPAHAAGTAVVIHGYYDHTGLYGHLIRHLLGRRLAVLAFDLPGHGLSSGAPATIDSFDHYGAALNACLDALGEHLPGPGHLLGQSTGGAVAMEWLLAGGYRKDTVPFSKIVLLAPLVRPYRWSLTRFVYLAARMFIRERPRTFAGNSDDPAFLEFLRDRDPLQARILPVQWVTAMIAWRRRFERYPATDIAPLVIQGRADTTVDWRYNLKVIGRLFAPRIFYIAEARHHLVNESPQLRAQIFQAIDGELLGRRQPPAPSSVSA